MATLTATSRMTGRDLDDDTLRAYGLDESMDGLYAVIQHGYACLGYGDTREAALDEAARCCCGPVVEHDEPCHDGAIEVVQIVVEG